MIKNIQLPFTKSQIENIASKFPTPFYIYDEEAIRKNARNLNQAFGEAGVTGFKNYFAVKALPNPKILEILAEEGMGFDCSSIAELVLSQAVLDKDLSLLQSYTPSPLDQTKKFNPHYFEDGLAKIIFTSNNTPALEYAFNSKIGGILNFDDITHIDFYQKYVGVLPQLVSLRLNPGTDLSSGKDNVIGKPEEAKFGLTTAQLFEAYEILKHKGVQKFGLHTMVVSNELKTETLLATVDFLFKIASEIQAKLGIKFEFINLGGGIGVNYMPEQSAVSYQEYAQGIASLYQKYGLKDTSIMMENGRRITGPYGYLVTKVIHQKHTHKEFVGVDATMANLMRPGMYNAYHHITVLGKENQQQKQSYDVVGSLCENNDKFAIDRDLPVVEIGDYLAIHEGGAHSHAMGFNYNGKLRSSELLLKPSGEVELIRRKETLQDYFKTLWGLKEAME
jgi:diaminopimelate decarboxylase